MGILAPVKRVIDRKACKSDDLQAFLPAGLLQKSRVAREATSYFFKVLTMIGPALAAPPDETAVTKNS